MTKLKDKAYPIKYPNGNITFTDFKSETYDYRFKGISLATYRADNTTSFGLIVSRYDASNEEVADLALDFNDAIALRDALILYIQDEYHRMRLRASFLSGEKDELQT